MDENKIIPYIEPIFRFCCNRISNRYDAEDLASEIICHILDGMTKYNIKSLDAWVWRIAHNRYARFVDAKAKNREILSDNNVLFEVGPLITQRLTRNRPCRNMRRYFAICTPFLPSTELFLWTTISEICR